eukprot:4807321-Karenia_brevis.AAC.1
MFEDAVDARRHALFGSNLPDFNIHSWQQRHGSYSTLDSIDVQLLKEFEEIPRSDLNPEDWISAISTRVTWESNILALEGDASVLGLNHIVRSGTAIGTRVLGLIDNLPLALAITKGRANSGYLKRTLK